MIEIIHRGPAAHTKVVLFDFDGTLSLIRTGWMEVMVPMMVEVLAELKTGETEDQLRDVVEDFVWRLTGKETIYQMIELAEQVKRRGGTPLDPLDYKKRYLDRLWLVIRDRVEGAPLRQVPARSVPRPRRAAAARSAERARPAPLPGQRHRRDLHEGGGRAAGRHPLFRRRRLRRARRLSRASRSASWSSASCGSPKSRAISCSASATATSRSKRSSKSAASRSASPPTSPNAACRRPVEAPAPDRRRRRLHHPQLPVPRRADGRCSSQ